MPHNSACSSCGRAIIWTVSSYGARLPLDARPVTVYEIEEDDGQVNALNLKDQIDDLWPGVKRAKLYVSHFLTCPNADEHSKGKK